MAPTSCGCCCAARSTSTARRARRSSPRAVSPAERAQLLSMHHHTAAAARRPAFPLCMQASSWRTSSRSSPSTSFSSCSSPAPAAGTLATSGSGSTTRQPTPPSFSPTRPQPQRAPPPPPAPRRSSSSQQRRLWPRWQPGVRRHLSPRRPPRVLSAHTTDHPERALVLHVPRVVVQKRYLQVRPSTRRWPPRRRPSSSVRPVGSGERAGLRFMLASRTRLVCAAARVADTAYGADPAPRCVQASRGPAGSRRAGHRHGRSGGGHAVTQEGQEGQALRSTARQHPRRVLAATPQALLAVTSRHLSPFGRCCRVATW